jgi:hypothetical protein
LESFEVLKLSFGGGIPLNMDWRARWRSCGTRQAGAYKTRSFLFGQII